jgi:hypothetical protein
MGQPRELGCERRQLIFLLNAMSYYWDLAVHGILGQATAPSTWEQIWIMGGRGPFGCYTDPGMVTNPKEFLKFMGKLGPFKPKKFMDETELILKQADGFNCGLLCTLFIWDKSDYQSKKCKLVYYFITYYIYKWTLVF